MSKEQIQTNIDPCDLMRQVEALADADPRMLVFGVVSADGVRAITQQDRWDFIDAHRLNAAVPESVLIHYETARNLYLYAWHVYRFHAVAEQHVLATLEFALRSRVQELKLLNQSARHKPGLAQLLRLALEHDLVSNDRLRARHRWAADRAAARRDLEEAHYMESNNLTSLESPDMPIEPSKDDLTHDWIGAFAGALPQIRNQYAHGSQMLHASVLRTFEIVAELVNQLYEPI